MANLFYDLNIIDIPNKISETQIEIHSILFAQKNNGIILEAMFINIINS